MNDILANNYYSLLDKVKQACNKLNKPQPMILAVSKTHHIDKIIEIYNLGQRDFGENYAQELANKANDLKHLAINWHYIGHIQSNKIKLITQYASYIHGLTTIKHAQKINEYCISFHKTIKVLIEINITNKNSRNGISNWEEITALANAISKLNQLELVGVMGIATDTDDQEQINQDFANLYQAFMRLQTQYPQLNTLSMGMSKDYPTAIQNNSTLIRIGSQIFGSRN